MIINIKFTQKLQSGIAEMYLNDIRATTVWLTVNKGSYFLNSPSSVVKRAAHKKCDFFAFLLSEILRGKSNDEIR